jgi:hypothetical protein
MIGLSSTHRDQTISIMGKSFGTQKFKLAGFVSSST